MTSLNGTWGYQKCRGSNCIFGVIYAKKSVPNSAGKPYAKTVIVYVIRDSLACPVKPDLNVDIWDWRSSVLSKSGNIYWTVQDLSKTSGLTPIQIQLQMHINLDFCPSVMGSERSSICHMRSPYSMFNRPE